MQILRTIIWVLLLVALLLFSIANWTDTVTVRIWQGLVVDTKIPAIVIVSFLVGFLPMWLYHRAARWRLSRKIASLENAARTAASTPIASDEPEADPYLRTEAGAEPVPASTTAEEQLEDDPYSAERSDKTAPNPGATSTFRSPSS